ncbi:MAG: hypothetical protein GY742_07050 [Hyphomicrobiales bacterium]|nr:hypothetical protein [Hyphomicrobiales bacterium]
MERGKGQTVGLVLVVLAVVEVGLKQARPAIAKATPVNCFKLATCNIT